MISMGGIRSRVSVAFYLVDQFTGLPVKSAHITVEEQMVPYVNKQDGYYIYVNLPPGKYTFAIQAPNYMAVNKAVELSQDQAKVWQLQVQLQHSLSSRLLDAATKIIGLVQDSKKRPLANEKVQAGIITANTYMRLTEEVQKGADSIKPYSREGMLLEGKKLLVVGAKGREVVEVSGYQPEQESYSLTEPLQNDFSSGAQLYPIWDFETDEEGQFVLPVPSQLIGREREVELIVFHQKKSTIQQLEIILGKSKEVAISLK